MSEIVFAPEVGSVVLGRTSMQGHVRREFPNGAGLATNSVELDVDDWVVVDGVVVSGVLYPPSITVLVACSPDGVRDSPRRVIPEEYGFGCDARWIAGKLYDGKRWQAADGRMAADLPMVAGGVTSDKSIEGTTPQELPEGYFVFYDKTESEFRQMPCLSFSGSDTMSTRTTTWATNNGAGAMCAVVLNQAANADSVTWVIGFTTPDPTEAFGLGVQVRSMNRLELVVEDVYGKYVLAYINIRREIGDVVLFGVRYDATTSKAYMTYIDDFTNKEVSGKLRDINGRPAGDTLAGLDVAIMPTLSEQKALLFDACAWTSAPSEYEWHSAIGAYAELYGVAAKEQ